MIDNGKPKPVRNGKPEPVKTGRPQKPATEKDIEDDVDDEED